MINLSTAPKKMRALLIFCLAGAVVSIGTAFYAYSVSRNVTKAVGKDTVPSIIAAQNIKATLADAHSNAMNAMVTKEKLGGKFWNLYRKDMDALHSQLVDASQNITSGDAERIPLLAIMSNISAYEYTVGGAVSSGAEISVDQFMEANRLMQQKILPASTAYNKVNLEQLDRAYNNYIRSIDKLIFSVLSIGFIFLAILIGTQIYLFKKTHRIINIGLLLATILFLVSTVYSANTLKSVKADLYSAKNDAFNSIDSLWNAKAAAYNAKSFESLYLLHHETGIVQTADTINFNLSAERLCSDPKTALSSGKFDGLLNDELSNITFSGEKEAATDALQQWAKYVDMDKQVRSLEYDSKHNEAIALSVGDGAGQSNYEFSKFDAAIGEAIKINQVNFDLNINSALKTLNAYPFVTAAFLLIIISACTLGMKSRMDEYKV